MGLLAILTVEAAAAALLLTMARGLLAALVLAEL
jgi:hypothetical protein